MMRRRFYDILSLFSDAEEEQMSKEEQEALLEEYMKNTPAGQREQDEIFAKQEGLTLLEFIMRKKEEYADVPPVQRNRTPVAAEEPPVQDLAAGPGQSPPLRGY